MSRDELGSIRRSQVITTFGPGAVVDFRTGGRNGAPVSAIVCGLDEWDKTAEAKGLNHSQTIHEPRLERVLSVAGFRLPPVSEDGYGSSSRNSEWLHASRFPEWLQCPRCNTLAVEGEWFRPPGDCGLQCRECSRKAGRHDVYVVPVRFVTACPNGHLDEFPWNTWLRHEEDCPERDLKLESWGGAGLSDLVLECRGCGRKRNMEGCFGEDVLGMPCSGRRPWLDSDDDDCDENLRTVQRGASNLFFPRIRSALGIPPWTRSLQKKLGRYWGTLLEADSASERRQLVEILGLAEKFDSPVDELMEGIERRLDFLRRDVDEDDDLRPDEYKQFVNPAPPSTPSHDEIDDFRAEAGNLAPELSPYLERITLVTRLREVRALEGFTRISPPSPERELSTLSEERKSWLPAVEVRGEGLFIQLSPDRLQEWERKDVVARRIRALRQEEIPENVEGKTARFLLLHSLAHSLIRSVSLECGYSVASLRERIYSGPQMGGILLYTATPDSDGTLGGLVQQGEEERFRRVIQRAVDEAGWCSSDPLCIRGNASLSEPLNISACHDCLLLPETSCEEFNRLLDRALLVGTPDEPDVGYFRGLAGR